jgi:hypothetical protein
MRSPPSAFTSIKRILFSEVFQVMSEGLLAIKLFFKWRYVGLDDKVSPCTLTFPIITPCNLAAIEVHLCFSSYIYHENSYISILLVSLYTSIYLKCIKLKKNLHDLILLHYVQLIDSSR